jgi:hypothetical protein
VSRPGVILGTDPAAQACRFRITAMRSGRLVQPFQVFQKIE